MIGKKLIKELANVASQKDLQFDCPYPLHTIHRIEVTRSVNEHAHLKLTGILKETQVEECLYKASYEDTLTFQVGEQILFKGRLKKLKISNALGVHYITIEGISGTASMDAVTRCRSFQNVEEPYAEVVNKVIKRYAGSHYIDTVSNEAAIGEPRIQYNETDWQFLKRLVSYLGGVLVADVTDTRSRFWFGLPQGSKEISINEGNYILRKNLHAYRDSVDNYQADIAEAGLVECEVESHIYLDIGDKVIFQGRTMFVWASTAILEKGVLMYQYKLMRADGIRQNPIPHSKIQGVSLLGRVIHVAENMVKVHLLFDENQHPAGAYWFPYSADGNNGIYAMPQIDFGVALYFPGTREKDAMATYSLSNFYTRSIFSSMIINRNNNTNTIHEKYRLSDPGNKRFSTCFGKEMDLHKDNIIFSATKNDFNLLDNPKEFSEEVLQKGSQNYSITMDNNHGIMISSDFDINIKAEGDIRLDTCKEIIMNANESIHFFCRGDSIGFDNQLNFISGSVKYGK